MLSKFFLLAFHAQAHDNDGNGNEDEGKHIEDTAKIKVLSEQHPYHNRCRHAAEASETGSPAASESPNGRRILFRRIGVEHTPGARLKKDMMAPQIMSIEAVEAWPKK